MAATTAEILHITNRGIVKSGYNVDIIIFDKKNYSPKTSYSNWNQCSVGIEYVIVNGAMVIEQKLIFAYYCRAISQVTPDVIIDLAYTTNRSMGVELSFSAKVFVNKLP